MIDETSEVAEVGDILKQMDIVMDALRNPHKPRPEGEWVVGEVVRQWVFCHLIFNIGTYPTHRFWERAIPHASAQSQKRLIATFDDTVKALVQQAVDRSKLRIRDVQSYMDLRRDTVGVKPSFALLEQGLDIPDEVMEHPTIKDMTTASIEIIFLTNVSDFSVDIKSMIKCMTGHRILQCGASARR